MIMIAVRTPLQHAKSFHSTKIIAKVKLKSLSGAIRLTIYPTANLPLLAQYPTRHNEQARRSNGFRLSHARYSDSGSLVVLVMMLYSYHYSRAARFMSVYAGI